MIKTLVALLIMLVPKINVDIQDSAAVSRALDGLQDNAIACCNWPEVRSYVPEVSFRIFHTGKYMVIRYDVREKSTRAVADADDGKVWEDSCVEFFLSPDGGNSYYNFETSCIGKMHIGHRVSGEAAVHANAQQFALVKRYPTIGKEPFEEITGDNHWQMTLVVPIEALFADKFTSWSGQKFTMNFYKCGDKLSTSHYVSWAPIGTPRPNFHRPDYFAPVEFED